jgi:fluoroquinolone transport system permease protein
MTRFFSSLRKDAVLQYRGGFYVVGAAVALLYVAILSRIPADWPVNLPLIIPLALIVNVLITTFYFVAALVLLEKAEGTLAATAVSPLRAGEYLGAKVVSLAILALGENAAVLVLFYGTEFDTALLGLGLIMLCGFYTLVGFVAISRYDSINSFLIPSGVAITALLLPPMVLHFRADPMWLIYLHPVQPFLSLVSAAFMPPQGLQIAYGLGTGLLWLTAAYFGARRAYRQLIAR